MIERILIMKKYNVTVNGVVYEVEVEEVGAVSAPVAANITQTPKVNLILRVFILLIRLPERERIARTFFFFLGWAVF